MAEPGSVATRPRLIAVALGSVIACNLFLFAPATLYAGNVDEFASPLLAILGRYAWPAILMTFVLAAPALLLRGRRSGAWLSFLAALAVLTWLQGNILVWDYGVMDGRSIDWLDGAWRGVLDVALWVAVILVAVYQHERVGRLLMRAAYVVFAIQFATLLITLPAIPQSPAESAGERPAAAAREAVFRFSARDNVLHVVMDGFQSDLFEEIVSDPANADLRESLAGFTFFRENLGVFPYTEMTLPAIVSGRIYRNEQPKAEFVDQTLKGHTILNAAHAAGYEVDIAAPTPLANVYTRGYSTHAYAIANNQHVSEQDYVTNDAAKLFDLSLFRLVPHFAKIFVYNDHLWLAQAQTAGEAWLQLQYFADLAFLAQFEEQMTADRGVPVYKLIHVMLSHTPTAGNEDCEYDGKRAITRENVIVQATCGLRGVVRVLEKMRALGIYDDSTIVLMADHGAWIEAKGFEPAAGNDAVNGLTVGMALPVLAVKPGGAQHAMQTSDAPTSIVDVAQTIATLAGIEADFGGRSVFDLQPGASRPRTHLIYAYGTNDEDPGYLNPPTEFAIDGSPFRASDWRELGRHRPGGGVEP